MENQTTENATSGSKAMFWVGWAISVIPILMMGVLPIVFQIFMPKMMTEGMNKYGYPAKVGLPLLIIEVCCTVIYAIPQTAVLGAILMTGYLGGAVATHVRVGEPPIMPIIFGVLVWLGLFLRDARVRALIPLRR